MKSKGSYLVVPLGVAVLALFLQYIGVSRFVEILSRARVEFIALAFAVLYFSFLLRAWRWRIILGSMDYDFGLTRLFSYILVGWFANSIIPARGGDLVRGYILKKKERVPLRKGLGSILVERFLDAFTILLFSSFFAYMVLRSGGWGLIGAAYITAVAAFLLFILFIYFSPRMKEGIIAISSWGIYQRVTSYIFNVIDQVHVIARKKDSITPSVVLSIIIWFCDVIIAYLIFLGLSYPIAIQEVAFVAFTTNLIAAAPLIPGGVGQIELGALSLYLLVGVPMEVAGSVVIIGRIISYWSMLLVSGMASYLHGYEGGSSGKQPR